MVPPAPCGLFVAPRSATELDIHWMPAPGATSYVVYEVFLGVQTIVGTPISNTLRRSGLTGASTRSYSVATRIGSALGSPCAAVTATTFPTPDGSRRGLQPADFQRVGSFVLPFAVDPFRTIKSNTIYGGIAHRYDPAGTPTLFCTGDPAAGAPLYEIDLSSVTPSLTAPYPVARVARYWGNAFTNNLVFAKPGYNGGALSAAGSVTLTAQPTSMGDGFPIGGLCWVEATKTLFASYFQYYNVGYINHPSVSSVTLDDATGTVTAHGGPWKTSASGPGHPNSHQTAGGVLAVPQPWADAKLAAAGKPTFLLGFGGNRAGNAACSWGGALFATTDLIPSKACQAGQVGEGGACQDGLVTGDPTPHAPHIATTCLMSSYHPAGHLGTRPPGYTNDVAGTYSAHSGAITGGAQETLGAGSWTWSDNLFGGASVIDDPDGNRPIAGLALAAQYSFGRISYKPTGQGGNACDGGYLDMFGLLTFEQLAAVAAGSDPSVPQPLWFPAEFPGADRRQVPYQGTPTSPAWWTAAAKQVISGTAFDPKTDLFYALQPGAGCVPGHAPGTPMIHIWKIKRSDP